MLALIAAPGDVPTDHLLQIRKTISQWNLSMGRTLGVVVLPLSWTEHSASTFGDRPQALLNDQLVEQADFVFAVFRDRLGTPTGTDESGTAEEIAEMAQAGKPVSVFEDLCAREPLSGTDASAEKTRLEEYLTSLKSEALVLSHSDLADLAGQVGNVLSNVAGKVQQGTADQLENEEVQRSENPAHGVWPRVETIERMETDSKGRIRTKRNWYLVLENTTGQAVRSVDFAFPELQEGQYFRVIKGDPIEVMPPEGVFRFPLAVAMGSPDQLMCVVRWTDSSGQSRETAATVRI